MAGGLGVTLTQLVEVAEEPAIRVVKAADAVTLWHGMEGSSAKLMVASDPPDDVELWDWHIAVVDGYVGHAHRLRTRELLFVVAGTLALVVEGHVEHAHARAAVLFRAERAHEYRNGGTEPLYFLIFDFLIFVLAKDLSRGKRSATTRDRRR